METHGQPLPSTHPSYNPSLKRRCRRITLVFLQCNAELLHKYYVNLVRSHSGSQFIIVGSRSSESASSSERSEDEDGEIVSVGMVQPSRPGTPGDVIMETVSTGAGAPSPGSSTSVSNFMGVSMPSTERPYQGQTPPTIEQNMAFADLQRDGLP